MTATLELRSVSKTYGDGRSEVRALVDVDFSAARGELVAVMGPSGSGKSSLLTIAGTLEAPSGGTVFVEGVDVSGLRRNEQSALRRRTIGFVFQDFNLLAGLTAEENVSMPLELDGAPVHEARRAARVALEQLGLADRARQFPDDLSGGERQRVAIARAIVGERHLVLADEPTGALDSVTGETVMRILRDATRRGASVVVVTHEAQHASWADRVVFLRDGRLVDQTSSAAGPETLLATAPDPRP